MSGLKSLILCGLVLACAGCASNHGRHADITKAMVRAIHGTAQFSIGGQPVQPLKINMVLPEGTTITTGPDSKVDLQVNGRISMVRIAANSTMSLKTMRDLGDGNSETMLEVENGTVFGSVKKISTHSTYEVKTPRGTAGMRPADWAVQVTQQTSGKYTVTFTCATGEVFVVANVMVAGVVTQVPKTLSSGQAWTPPDSAPTY